MSDKPVAHQPVRVERSAFTCGSCSRDRSEPCHHYGWTMKRGKRGKHRICCGCWCDAPERKTAAAVVQQRFASSFAIK